MNNLISVIIPCHNEESVINTTYERLTNVLNTANLSYELIFINDGSTDLTLSALEKISSRDSHVIVINFSRNFGHQPAVTAGVHYCTGDYAVIIDADLQDPPELIPGMLKIAVDSKSNVVYAVRNTRKGETFIKKITAKIFYRFINFLSDTTLPLDTGDFRLIDRKAINSFKLLREKHKYIRGLMVWIGFKQSPIFYDREPRFSGETKYPFLKMVVFATRGLLYFTKKPLKLATGIGFLCVCIGLILILYILISKLFYPSLVVSGWASVLTTVIFFGGIQLLTVGVLGEYIGNIFDEVKDRPEYIIDNIIKANSQEKN